MRFNTGQNVPGATSAIFPGIPGPRKMGFPQTNTRIALNTTQLQVSGNKLMNLQVRPFYPSGLTRGQEICSTVCMCSSILRY